MHYVLCIGVRTLCRDKGSGAQTAATQRGAASVQRAAVMLATGRCRQERSHYAGSASCT